jgi:hypothetical protein
MTRRMEIKAQEHQNKIELLKAQGERAAKAVSEGLAADAAWELESLRAHAGGWKDEFVLIVLSIPLVLCFFPQGAPIVAAGFASLGSTPLWYQTALVSVFLATYGIRWYRRTQSDT